jgi:prepilin-type N-terminal cleavage/methylation domain-containing protein
MSASASANRSATRGYTFVELLMSLLIFSIGVTGVIAMQKITVTSNQHAKDLAIATQIAQAWMDQLHADAIAWNHPSAYKASLDLNDTVWLSNVAQTNTTWIRPNYDAARSFGPFFDVQGRPLVDTDPNLNANTKFCTHIRLSWLYQPTVTSTLTGNGLIRAEVRVFWLRDGQPWPNNQPICSQALNTSTVAADAARYHFVYDVSAVRENTRQ